MMRTGLVSVTFRRKTPQEIIALVHQSGLDGIEWGADVHVLPGDLKGAAAVRQEMDAHGLLTLSYGSYYRLGSGDTNGFGQIAETASALGAPNIRVWAGTSGSLETDADQLARVIEDAWQCAGVAAEYGLDVSTEFHGNTLMDSMEASLSFLDRVSHRCMHSYWQPIHPVSEESRHLSEIAALRDTARLKNLHVYHWRQEQRLPLQDGQTLWRERIRLVQHCVDAALLEFVKDDSPEQFLEDASVLKQLCGMQDRKS